MFILVAIFNGLWKLFSFLLIKLGLWLSALFAVGYLITCLILRVPLSAEPGLTILIVGVVLLAVLGLLLSALINIRRSRTRQEIEGKERYKRYKGAKYSPDYDYDDRDEGLDDGDEGQEMRGRHRDEGRFSDKYDTKEQTKVETQKAIKYEYKGSEPEKNFSPPKNRYADFPNSNGKYEIPNERPQVFATRKDPNILIMEFSDRLMIFEKCPNGGEPRFLDVEYK